MKMQKFDVYIGRDLVNQVFYTEGTKALEVRKGLINHDGMPGNISVYRCHISKPVYDDTARFTHPEELRE